MKPLTFKQCEAIINAYSTKADAKRTPEEVERVRAGRFKSFNSFADISDLDALYQHALNERKRLVLERKQKIATGEINTKHTPTDVDGFFGVLKEPQVGQHCHVSWAYKGAIFVIKQLDDIFAYLDNPKYKRKTLLKVYRSDLRLTRNQTIKQQNNENI